MKYNLSIFEIVEITISVIISNSSLKDWLYKKQ